MAHAVSFTIPERMVGNVDIEFTIHTDGNKMGTLKISKGKIVWLPAYAKKYEYSFRWDRFARLMEEKGHRKEITTLLGQ